MDKMKILCVDDEGSILETMKVVLGVKDYEIITALGGKKGLETFRQNESELCGIFSDLRMGDMDGKTLIKEIRKTSDIPAIAISAYLDDTTRGQCKEAGFNDYIKKPWNIKQLYDAIDNIFTPYAKDHSK